MLEDRLDFFSVDKRIIPAPSLDRLRKEYFHAADVRCNPKNVEDFHKDIGRVITLRPDVEPSYSTSRVNNPMIRGYFAYGRDENENVVFEIYTPHPSVKAKFPPKALEKAIGLFLIRLTQEGYGIKPCGVEFRTTIEDTKRN